MSLYRGPSIRGTSTDTTHAMVLSATVSAINAANAMNAAKASEDAAKAASLVAAANATAAANAQIAPYTNASAASAASALATQTAISDKYYGPLAANPVLRPSGAAMQVGDRYFNTVAVLERIFNGTSWQVSDVNTANLAALTGADIVGYRDGTTVGDALDVVIGGGYHSRKLSDVLDKGQRGGAVTIACYGDSITYGQDGSVTGVPGSLNGSTNNRSTQPYPENLQDALNNLGYTPAITVANRGYPGDTTVQGLSRWASASATDVAILMYGHNDANNYGGTGAVSLSNYRINLEKMILREASKGAAVIVLGPPNVQNGASNENIRPYALAARQLAAQFGCLFMDMAEVHQSLTKLWTDGIHLTSHAYAEMGWAIAALFAKRNGDMQRVAAGEIYYPDDNLGRGPSGCVIDFAGVKGNNRLLQLLPGQVYSMGVNCLGDMTPRIHSYNTDLSERITGAYMAGGGVDRGIPTPIFKHIAAYGFRQSFLGPRLRKGIRTFLLRNDGAATVYIEAIEFVGAAHLHVSGGGLEKSAALSGAFLPKYFASKQSSYWSCADFAARVTAPYTAIAKLRLSESFAGIAIWKDLPSQDTELFGANALFIMRNGTQLLIRDYVAGVGTDTTVAAVFPAGDSEDEFQADLNGTTLTVYINSVLKATVTVANLSGYIGLLAVKAATMECKCFYYAGHVKGPY